MYSIYLYSIGYTKQADLMFHLDIISQHSIIQWKCNIRDVFAQYFIANPQTVGGFGHTVEIEECLLVRRKYNVGHQVEQQWVFGGVDLDTNNVFMVPVANRTADTLLPIIQQFILPSTCIVSDLWCAYGGLMNLPQGYLHLTVNHSVNFVDPNTGATTNHVESTWQKAKQKHKQRFGTNRHLLETYLNEFVWMRRFGGSRAEAFENLVSQVRDFYQQ